MTTHNHDHNRALQQDARAWSHFAGLKYTESKRLMQYPLAQGILGERISARHLIEVLKTHPIVGDENLDIAKGQFVLGEFGVDSEDPLEIQSPDMFLEVVLCAEMLRMFTPVANGAGPVDEPEYSDGWTGSYSLKHVAEWFLAPEHSYISNGRLIWAAAALGLPMSEPDGPNVLIALPDLEYRYLRSTVQPSGARQLVHHNQPPGYLHLVEALKQHRDTGRTPSRWNGESGVSELQTSPFHEWLIAKIPTDTTLRLEFGTIEALAYDYRAGVEGNDHRVARDGRDLLAILDAHQAAFEAHEAARRAVAEWSKATVARP